MRSSWKPRSYDAARLLVRGDRQLVLVLAGDAPLERGQRRGLAHRQPGARLAVLRDRRSEVLRAHLGQRGEAALDGLGAVGLEQDLAQPLVDARSARRRWCRCRRRCRPRSGRGRSCWRPGSRPGCRCRRPAGCRRRGSRAPACEPSTDSRVRLKSRECLSTAPATTSPTRSPSRPKRVTRPSIAAVSMSWLEASA